MRVLLLGNNRVAFRLAEWLRDREEIVGLVLHPPERRRFGDEIVRASGVGADYVFDGSQLGDAAVLREIEALRPTLGVSAMFGYLLRHELLALLPAGCVNVHPSLLPYNRGAHPNVWSIVEGSPAGATIHYIDDGVDTGDIIAQHQIEVEPVDTGASLYHRLEDACIQLFQETWPVLRSGQGPRLPQEPSAGTHHRVRDLEAIDEIDLDRTYKARDLINILRARTFPPYSGAFFRHGARRVHLQLMLGYDRDETTP